MRRVFPSSTPPDFCFSEPGAATVLVVDDDRVSAEHVCRLVRGAGHRTLTAHNWTDALRAFTFEDVDLVLMDAVMPNVDGFKLTRIFRERSASYIPIVFLTGLTDERARRRGIEAGADDLLTKPVDELELAMRLVAMLRIRRLTKALEEKSRILSQLAKIDALTNLANRRVLDEHLPIEVERARRYGRDLSVLMIDVDRFKVVNDTFGHDVGDQVLVCLGASLVDSIRASDQAHRYGGEEFVVVAVETGMADAVQLAQRIRSTFRARSAEASPAGVQTLSVGVADLRSMSSDCDSSGLLVAADAALYRAKRSGRDQVHVAELE